MSREQLRRLRALIAAKRLACEQYNPRAVADLDGCLEALDTAMTGALPASQARAVIQERLDAGTWVTAHEGATEAELAASAVADYLMTLLLGLIIEAVDGWVD